MTSLPTDYGPLVHELHRIAAVRKQPINGVFELTSRCNLFCRMCYIRHSASDMFQREKELSSDAWRSLARQAVDNGMVFLLLTGGEVFLRSDFFEIYESLTRMGLIITLFTNGTLITEAIAERLAQAPPSRTEITLYGATALTYEVVTGVPGSYARCCKGIEALVKQHVPLVLKTTVTRQNVNEVEAMQQMAHNWNLPFYSGWRLTRRPDGAPTEVEDFRLSAEDGVAFEAIEHRALQKRTEATRRESNADDNRNFYCRAGKSVFSINPMGEMNVCPDLPLPAVRPLKIGFRRAWEQVQRYVGRAQLLSSACRNCNERIYCPRCPAWSLMETGTMTEPVPYLCQIARARKERYESHA